jgi:hypothetical protein
MKTNNALTVDNIITVLNQQNYTVEQFTNNVNDPNRLKLNDYNKVVTDLLNYFFIDYSTKHTKYSDDLYGSLVLINRNIKNKWLENFSLIEFKLLYPNIISKLWKENEIKFNIYEFGILYSFMVDNYENIKNHSSMTDISILLFRYIINFTFGATIPRKYNRSIILMSEHEKIVSYNNNIFTYIFENNQHNVFYIDCDCIYLDYLSPEIMSKINELNLPYKIENNLNGIFIQKMKFIIERDKKIKQRGLSGSFKSKYKLEKTRLKKLQKINNIINNKTITEIYLH